MRQFVRAVMSRWPNAVLQFEDFSIQHALVLLERYRQHHLVFNDDIQGTAATALAGLYGALAVLVNECLHVILFTLIFVSTICF